MKQEKDKTIKATKNKAVESTLDLENKIRNIRSALNYKLIGIAVLSVLIFTGLVFALSKANNLKTQLSMQSEAESNLDSLDADVLKSQLAANKSKIERNSSYIANDSDIIDYVQYLDELKNTGVINDFTFASNEKIKDKTGSSGYLLRITINGAEESIANALNSISNLPFLTRGVNFELASNEEGQYGASYEVILYTNE